MRSGSVVLGYLYSFTLIIQLIDSLDYCINVIIILYCNKLYDSFIGFKSRAEI